MLLTIAVRTLEAMFGAGAIGCVVVLLLTTVEDIRTLFGKDEQKSDEHA
jgi:hypothetical protein